MDNELFYSIGGLTVRIAGGATADAIGRIAGFDRFQSGFESGFASVAEIDIDIRTDRHIDQPPPHVPPIHSFTVLDMAHRLHSYGGGYVFEMCGADGRRAAAVGYDPFTGRVVMDTCRYEPALKYAVWVAYAFAAAARGVIPIHASSVVKDGVAVLFLGGSGTGKSTHSRLWLRHVGGSYLLNDDSPLLRISESGIHACGSPWSGKTHCYRNESHPLKALVRLRQAPRNRMRHVDGLDSIGAVYPSCPPLFAGADGLSGPILDAVGRIVGAVPVYVMECRPDAQAAKLAYGSIYGTI